MTTHDTSTTSRAEEKKIGRSQDYRLRIHALLKETNAGWTDRQIMVELNVTDANLVRPEITRLKQQGLLREVGKTRCSVTGRQVRVVAVTDKPYEGRLTDLQTEPARANSEARKILKRLIEQGTIDDEGDFLLGDVWPDTGAEQVYPEEPAIIAEAIALFAKLGEPLKIKRASHER